LPTPPLKLATVIIIAGSIGNDCVRGYPDFCVAEDLVCCVSDYATGCVIGYTPVQGFVLCSVLGYDSSSDLLVIETIAFRKYVGVCSIVRPLLRLVA
jgi:hypothetical protein